MSELDDINAEQTSRKIRAQADEIETLRQQLETERIRLAACGCAALGYFNGCADEYKSASLDDVLALRQKVAKLEAQDMRFSMREPTALRAQLAAVTKERDDALADRTYEIMWGEAIERIKELEERLVRVTNSLNEDRQYIERKLTAMKGAE